MVNSQEINEFLIVFNILLGNLNSSSQVQDVIFLTWLALEDTFNGLLSLTEFIQFLLVIPLFTFSGWLLLHYLFSSKQSLINAPDIQQFSLDPVISVFEWIFPTLKCRIQFFFCVSEGRVSQCSFHYLAIRIVLNVIILILEETIHDCRIGGVRGVSNLNHLLQLFLLNLHHWNDLPQEVLELNDIVLVFLDISFLLVLIHIEVQPVFFKNLHGCLFL